MYGLFYECKFLTIEETKKQKKQHLYNYFIANLESSYVTCWGKITVRSNLYCRPFSGPWRSNKTKSLNVSKHLVLY